MVDDMQAIFTSVVSQNTSESSLIIQLWKEIETAYHDETRYYHTMEHLQNVHHELLQVKQNISDWDSVCSLFYHDIIYIPTRTDNESKSAELAKARLESIHLPEIQIEKCMQMILASKDHTVSEDDDINFFTDADLSILGSSRSVYADYCHNVRKEYAELPDSIYIAGRKTFLQKLLNMPAIFKTDSFYRKYEKIARENIDYELDML